MNNTNMKTVEQYKNLLTEGHYAASSKYILPLTENKRVLDLGCGAGLYLERFGKDSVGIEASNPNIEILRKKGLQVVKADLNQPLPFEDESFDIVFCSHILEHVNAPIELLKESYRVLKNNHYLIISLPVEKGLARLVLRDHYFEGHPTHLYSFSMDCLKQLFKITGFKYQDTFVDLPGARKLHLVWFMDLIQLLPFSFSRFFASNFSVIGKKHEKE